MNRTTKLLISTALLIVLCSLPSLLLAGRSRVKVSFNPNPATLGGHVNVTARGVGFSDELTFATIIIKNANGETLVDSATMFQQGDTIFTYSYDLPSDEMAGRWQLKCKLYSSSSDTTKKINMVVEQNDDPIPPPTECPDNDNDGYTDAACGGTDCNDNDFFINPGASEVCGDGIDQNCSGADLNCPTEPPNPTGTHQDISYYDGPSTCVACHADAANSMLNSLHMQWSGPTPDLSNTNGEELGKAVAGINTFCTYAMSSGGACFGCHVRADGNAPHAPDVNDVDCLMCHSDTYQRKTVADPNNTETVIDILGQQKTYQFGAQDAEGNYLNEPNFAAMPDGTTMVELARNVHLPTKKSCLRCHAKAGGGDWTKRGDIGLSTANPSYDEDIHMSNQGADLACADCHFRDGDHLVGGRGIDLRITEGSTPNCQNCHDAAPHSDATINRHALGQLSCQVCHIRTFAKGGATEMSRDWLAPHWNPAFCNGQGGWVGHEVKQANVSPDYTWFDGTSYVYNLGEQISPEANGLYAMAKANGGPFDGLSQIVPIKRHVTNTPLHESGQIVGPKIMRMFMTGDFDQAVQAGMEDQGLVGNYVMVDAYAEMLITHGIDPKENAPSCSECHDGSGQTADGTKMLPFAELGYHQFSSTNLCSLCHSSKNMKWQMMHGKHVDDKQIDCVACHSTPPIGLSASRNVLCSSCHEYQSESDLQVVHKKHLEKKVDCSTCHTYSY